LVYCRRALVPVICSLAVAAGSMIMIGIMLYKDWPQ
jgi:hypothetical protein